MILVLTTEAGDFSHLKIVEWINYYKAKFLIISGERLLRGEDTFTIKGSQIYFNEINLTKEVKAVFYRRWIYKVDVKFTNDKFLNQSLNRNLLSEMFEIRNFLFKNLKNATWFPNANTISVNKLSILEEASQCGLNVPDFMVTNSLKDLKEFYKKCGNQIITKAIGNFQKSIIDNEYVLNPIYTKKLEKELIDKLPQKFALSFFQELIEKKFEYRILYFSGKCYATAILSQENDLTKFDSRVNNEDLESKLVPIELETQLNQSIVEFMNKIGLNTGSLDFIHAQNDLIYFLEVNPVGQIGGYSERCVLDFEKEIVEHLISVNNA